MSIRLHKKIYVIIYGTSERQKLCRVGKSLKHNPQKTRRHQPDSNRLPSAYRTDGFLNLLNIFIDVMLIYMPIYIHSTWSCVQILWFQNHSEEWRQGVRKRKEKENLQSSQRLLGLPFSTSASWSIQRNPWFFCGLHTAWLPRPK